jgi:hypothetical protein
MEDLFTGTENSLLNVDVDIIRGGIKLIRCTLVKEHNLINNRLIEMDNYRNVVEKFSMLKGLYESNKSETIKEAVYEAYESTKLEYVKILADIQRMLQEEEL